MAFFGNMGRAIGGAMGMKRPAPVQPMQRGNTSFGGLGKMNPQQGAGLGPSNPMMSKFGMMAQKIRGPQNPAMGANYGMPAQPPPMQAPTPDMAPNDVQGMQESQGPVMDQGALQDQLNARNAMMNQPEPMPKAGASFGTPAGSGDVAPVNQGLGPRPDVMRRPMMNPRMMGGRGRM